MSIRRACAVFGVSRSYYAYVPRPRDDSEVISALVQVTVKITTSDHGPDPVLLGKVVYGRIHARYVPFGRTIDGTC